MNIRHILNAAFKADERNYGSDRNWSRYVTYYSRVDNRRVGTLAEDSSGYPPKLEGDFAAEAAKDLPSIDQPNGSDIRGADYCTFDALQALVVSD